MTISLSLLFEAINQVKDEHELRSQLVPKIGEYFAAKRSGIFFFDQLPLAGLKPAGNVIKLFILMAGESMSATLEPQKHELGKHNMPLLTPTSMPPYRLTLSRSARSV